jgi:hypothetical protein
MLAPAGTPQPSGEGSVRSQRRGKFAALAVLVAVFLVGCERIAPPPLVRDGAGLFSEEARTDAEARLRGVATQHGIWAFVITDPVGDPPRMLDEPMQEADRRGVRAVAILLSDERVVGGGYSGASADLRDSSTLSPPNVDDLLAAGEYDAALERIVDYLVSWAASPAAEPEEPAPGGEVPPLPTGVRGVDSGVARYARAGRWSHRPRRIRMGA